MIAFNKIYIEPHIHKSDFSEKIFIQDGIYRLNKLDFAKFYTTFYRSIYPNVTDDVLFDLYLLASDLCFGAFLSQNRTAYRISNYWSQLTRDEFDSLMKTTVRKKISKESLPFEHYYADYLISGRKSIYFDTFKEKCKVLGSGFIFFMLANCFRAMCGGLYSAPTIEQDDLRRFIPSFQGSLREFPFLFDEKIPFFYNYNLNAEGILNYIFSHYDINLIKIIWTNFLSERIPEAACEMHDPKQFMERLFDKSLNWVKDGRWDEFIDDSMGLDWIIRYNNSPELIFHFRRNFYWYFKNNKEISMFSLN